MRYLLDTNVCIEILRGRNAKLRERLGRLRPDEPALCPVVWAELYYGAMLARDPAAELNRIDLAFRALPNAALNDKAARCYGELRAALRRSGQLIGANDLLIAAIAKSHGLVLVSHNTAEFSRVAGLQIEDWQGAEV